MFQETVLRLDEIESFDPIVVCNEAHRFLVTDHFEQISRTPQAIILEPTGRNTAPALTLAAIYSTARDSQSIILSLPADHIIQDNAAFRKAINLGLPLAEDGGIVTFGIEPTEPNIGFGYIRKGSAHKDYFSLLDFVEKPSFEKATIMMNSGEYLWNSGIFMLRSSLWIEQIRLHSPKILEACEVAMARGNEDGAFFRPSIKQFESSPNDAIDYAVMEKMVVNGTDGPDCWVIPLDAGWSDIGAWSTLWLEGEHDVSGNVTSGNVHIQSVNDSLILSNHRTVAAVGIEKAIIVETKDAVLVTTMESEQAVKDLVANLGEELEVLKKHHQVVSRPWGTYEITDSGSGFQVKHLYIKAGESLSLQKHSYRAEHWVVVSGKATVTREQQVFTLEVNESTFIPTGSKHRLQNKTTEPLEIIEIQSGSYLGEDDIVRFEDKYNRVKRQDGT
jgi:mannose-1-phosphate guanylyltransferase/mannose-6-phosphate isomerase